MIVEGGCACGAVRYRAAAAPRSSMICHCASCRRASAAPVTAWVTFAIDAFAFEKGEAATFVSSEPVRRRFCAACGTPLTYEHADRPGEVDVTTCSLDAPDAFPPTYHAQTGDDLTWVRFGDGRPAFRAWKAEG
jgi:hypothetical protein